MNGKRLRDIRKQLGLSIDQIANEAGVTKQAISLMERDRIKQPKFETGVNVLEALQRYRSAQIKTLQGMIEKLTALEIDRSIFKDGDPK